MTIQAINEQEKLRHERNELIARLESEQASAIKEQSKEYQRSLLLSSPGDLLRKLAVKRMIDNNGGNMGLGGFLSLDERAKKDAQDYSPGLNHKILEMGEQLRTLGDRDSIGATMTQTVRENAQRHALRGQYNINLGPSSSQILVSAQTQADITVLGQNARMAADALAGIPSAVASMVDANIKQYFNHAPGIQLPAAQGRH